MLDENKLQNNASKIVIILEYENPEVVLHFCPNDHALINVDIDQGIN